jgi:CHAD domain-containing protein
MTLTAEQRYGDAAQEIIAQRGEAVFAAREGVLDTTDIEGVHKMRVATRRLRAALEVFGPALHHKRAKRALVEVKALADALGERRDRDVQLERLARLAAETTGPEQRAVEVLAQELAGEQLKANRQLERALREIKRSRLRRRLARLAR